MLIRRIKNATHDFGPPLDWTEENGLCVNLPVRQVVYPVEQIVAYQSAWEPTPDELAILNAGGSVIVSIVGYQPAIAVLVETQE